MMTREEHRRIETNMKRQITRLNNRSKGGLLSLEEKLAMKREVKTKREELRQHVLHFHDLTSP